MKIGELRDEWTLDTTGWQKGFEMAKKQVMAITREAYASGGRALREIAKQDQIRADARKAPMIGEGIYAMLATAETHAPCRVFDANGLEWRDMQWVNTETGEGEQVLRDEGGSLIVDGARNRLCSARVWLAAPVLIKQMEWEYQS